MLWRENSFLAHFYQSVDLMGNGIRNNVPDPPVNVGVLIPKQEKKFQEQEREEN